MTPTSVDEASRPGATEPEAIFIVGVPRSGTSMMRAILERSDRIAIARENHFVGHMREREGARFYFRRAGDLVDDTTIVRIVDWIYSGEFQRMSRVRELSTFWKWLPTTIPRDELERCLLAAERSERGLMAAFMRVYADHLGRPVMGEKTPAHLAYVDTLLEWFPSAKVVHMIRDPRAVYVSDLRRRHNKPRKPYSWFMKVPLLLQAILLAQVVLTWRGAARHHRLYERSYPTRYRLVRFEDVMRQPEATVGDLFAFLGVAMPKDATEVKVVSQGFRGGEEGIDAAAADRWRAHIHPLARRLLSLVLGRRMAELGYTV